MDKSGRRFVVHFQLIEQPKSLAEKTNQKTRNYNLDLSSQRGHASLSETVNWMRLDSERKTNNHFSYSYWSEKEAWLSFGGAPPLEDTF